MEQPSAENAKPLSHEPVETDVRAVWRTGAVIAGVVIASYLLVTGLLKWFAATEGGPPANQAAKADPNWDEQNPLQRLRIREQQLLNNYEWVDPATGIARVPVDRAIEIISQNGLPAALQGPAPTNATSLQQPAPTNSAPAPAESSER